MAELDAGDEFLADFLPGVRPTLDATPPQPNGYDDMPSIVVEGLRSRGYNSRSDWHSQAACLGLLINLVRACPQLLADLRNNRVCFGINSPIEGRDLDLVVGTPGFGLWPPGTRQKTIAKWSQQLGLKYTLEPEIGRLQEFVIKQPLLAVEAKASVYSQEKAFCRVMRELDSFAYRTPAGTITAGLLMINVPRGKPKAPWDLVRKLNSEYPLRTTPRESRQGFDGFGAFFFEKTGNDTRLVDFPSPFSYPLFVGVLAKLYLAARLTAPGPGSTLLPDADQRPPLVDSRSCSRPSLGVFPQPKHPVQGDLSHEQKV
jgi:hypothetical protein